MGLYGKHGDKIIFGTKRVVPSVSMKVKALKAFVFGKYVSSIGAKAFYACGNLKTLTFNGTGKLTVGSNAFGKIHPKAKATVKKEVKKAYTKQLKKGKLKKSQIQAK